MFNPIWGEWSNLTNIFQIGWNQPTRWMNALTKTRASRALIHGLPQGLACIALRCWSYCWVLGTMSGVGHGTETCGRLMINPCVRGNIGIYTRWCFQIFSLFKMFIPIWRRFPIYDAYFSDGLVQPPTISRISMDISDLDQLFFLNQGFSPGMQWYREHPTFTTSLICFPNDRMDRAAETQGLPQKPWINCDFSNPCVHLPCFNKKTSSLDVVIPWRCFTTNAGRNIFFQIGTFVTPLKLNSHLTSWCWGRWSQKPPTSKRGHHFWHWVTFDKFA